MNEMTKNGSIGLSQVRECERGHPATLQEWTVNCPDDLVREEQEPVWLLD